MKVFNLLCQGASKSSIAECEALVYEFMDHGSLEEWLHPVIGTEEISDAPKNLTLLQRVDIAIGVACVLDYLHNHCGTPIVHCDLKPSNVLLNNELVGHVSDFGLARVVPQMTSNSSSNQTSSIGIREYGMGSEVSTYGDVYSFGILLLEMLGKRPTDEMFRGGRTFVQMSIPERVTEVADSVLLRVGNDDASISNLPNQYSSRAQKISECFSLIFRIGV
ncbi:unnamed protein product [Prunus armeniaca]